MPPSPFFEHVQGSQPPPVTSHVHRSREFVSRSPNTFGGSDLPITAAFVGLPMGGKVGVKKSIRQPTVPKGQVIYTDPVEFNVDLSPSSPSIGTLKLASLGAVSPAVQTATPRIGCSRATTRMRLLSQARTRSTYNPERRDCRLRRLQSSSRRQHGAHRRSWSPSTQRYKRDLLATAGSGTQTRASNSLTMAFEPVATDAKKQALQSSEPPPHSQSCTGPGKADVQ
ncbi:Uu.00g121220.m01.CDS01 [Anthostomella pinea]|uniref:Uu.00g121220.m01.CDS01 n=1 Tax=Anthostomella pinea TaxID=933095 RepID=A0AAI8VH03_9PEZI|nr:Uu.00g121220.m01.CDS01 [Anthostomella pinea]